MIKGKRLLAIIPARGGSKGVPRKNIKPLGSKPLIAWTVEAAKKSKYIDRLILSSEDPEIIEIGKKFGCEIPFIRPYELALDTTPGIDPVLHALENLPGYDYVVLLQVTSPLRIADDIDGCIAACVEQGAPACVSVVESDKSPYWMYTLNEKKQLQSVIKVEKPFLQRQDIPAAYALNGAVYIAECAWLINNRTFITDETIGYTMPKERSLDIDGPMDFLLCEFYLSQKSIFSEKDNIPT